MFQSNRIAEVGHQTVVNEIYPSRVFTCTEKEVSWLDVAVRYVVSMDMFDGVELRNEQDNYL